MRFHDIPGLSEQKKKLTEAVSKNQVAHARLFAGPPDTLALPLALANATYIHCLERGEHDACGKCSACVKSLKYIHPDTHFVLPASNVKNEKDEERFRSEILKVWRTFLLEQPFGNISDWLVAHGGEDKQALITRNESRQIIRLLALKPFESASKVMIIWHPELMHPSAANAILKILEEPAPGTYFMLVTDQADKLLPTILSRTQVVSVPLLGDEDVVAHLSASTDKTNAGRIARLSEGRLRTALALLEDEQDESAELFVSWMRTCFKKRVDELVAISDEFHNLDRLSQRNLLTYALHAFREVLLRQSGAHTLQRAQEDELKFITDFSKVITLEDIERAHRLINEASYHLERNGSAKMIFMDLSLQLAHSINPGEGK